MDDEIECASLTDDLLFKIFNEKSAILMYWMIYSTLNFGFVGCQFFLYRENKTNFYGTDKTCYACYNSGIMCINILNKTVEAVWSALSGLGTWFDLDPRLTGREQLGLSSCWSDSHIMEVENVICRFHVQCWNWIRLLGSAAQECIWVSRLFDFANGKSIGST